MKANFSLVFILVCTMSGCKDSDSSLLGKIGSKEMKASPNGAAVSVIQGYNQRKLQEAVIPTKPYYLVATKMTYPLTWFYYETVNDPKISGSVDLIPPIGQTCFEDDTAKCAREGKWRLVSSLPCDMELQLLVIAHQGGSNPYVGGIKIKIPCSLSFDAWNSVTN